MPADGPGGLQLNAIRGHVPFARRTPPCAVAVFDPAVHAAQDLGQFPGIIGADLPARGAADVRPLRVVDMLGVHLTRDDFMSYGCFLPRLRRILALFIIVQFGLIHLAHLHRERKWNLQAVPMDHLLPGDTPTSSLFRPLCRSRR